MTSTPVRVLLVDDDALVRRVLAMILRGSAWETEVLASGQEALDRLAAERFDVVVTDLRMPQVSGLDLARWLRAHRPDTRVVLVTGFATEDDEAQIEALGAALLRKPFEGPTLVTLVESVLAARDQLA